MRRAFVVVALALSFASWTSADTYPRQPAVDALHYRFAITVGEQSARIEGEATATFRILAPVSSIELDLISAAKDRGMTVTAVRQRDAAVAFTHADNRLRLPVSSDAGAGDEVTYTITYAGTPADGLQVMTNMHGERVLFSEGWPNRARHWLPMIDHPYDKATGEMIVTAPAQWQVVSNGVLVEEVDVDHARRRTHWKQSVPLPSWLFAIGVARFDAHHAGSVQGVPLQTWAFPQDRTAARALFEETSRRAMDFFSAGVGPYPYEKLANVQASGFGGGMENATVIFYGEKGVASGRGPVVHEIAHQWFGNSVTEHDWDDVWLSEGFATYFSLLYQEQYEGRDAFVQALARSRASILESAQKLPDTPVVHRNLGEMGRVLNTLVYQKGGWTLHMLRREIGADHFWSGIREYYRRYRDSNASTDDLRQVMEHISGQTLEAFFAQWLHRGGNPRVEATWTYRPALRTLELTLRQTQPGEPYLLTVDVDVLTPAGTRRETLRLDGASATATLQVDAEPSAITIDPDTWLLADIHIR
ncbi:MAG TPA: M1 family aminopeptidase [Vicinamibacterales bacterium]|nr:M1 family aminopeptidase [Vicinamibacterales bacterium]